MMSVGNYRSHRVRRSFRGRSRSVVALVLEELDLCVRFDELLLELLVLLGQVVRGRENLFDLFLLS